MRTELTDWLTGDTTDIGVLPSDNHRAIKHSGVIGVDLASNQLGRWWKSEGCPAKPSKTPPL